MEQDEYPDDHAHYQRSNLSTRQHEGEFYEDDRDVDLHDEGLESGQSQLPTALTGEEEEELRQVVLLQEQEAEAESQVQPEPTDSSL
jgi:hypothetical protein